MLFSGRSAFLSGSASTGNLFQGRGDMQISNPELGYLNGNYIENSWTTGTSTTGGSRIPWRSYSAGSETFIDSGDDRSFTVAGFIYLDSTWFTGTSTAAYNILGNYTQSSGNPTIVSSGGQFSVQVHKHSTSALFNEFYDTNVDAKDDLVLSLRVRVTTTDHTNYYTFAGFRTSDSGTWAGWIYFDLHASLDPGNTELSILTSFNNSLTSYPVYGGVGYNSDYPTAFVGRVAPVGGSLSDQRLYESNFHGINTSSLGADRYNQYFINGSSDLGIVGGYASKSGTLTSPRIGPLSVGPRLSIDTAIAYQTEQEFVYRHPWPYSEYPGGGNSSNSGYENRHWDWLGATDTLKLTGWRNNGEYAEPLTADTDDTLTTGVFQ